MSHAVTVPPGRGGGRSGGPSGQTWTGTQDGDLQSGTDKGGHGGAGSSGGHGGAGSSGGHGGAGSSGGHGRWSLGALASVPSARPLQPELLLPPPPPQNFPGEVRGYQEPSGAKQTGQYKTRQERPPGPDRQDRTAHRNRKPSRASSEAEASSGHVQESGALTGSLSNRLHFSDKGAGG